ncbi:MULTISPECIES: NHL repeat-containing protein [unclassified Duganella]|uniref:NHL repeat-containing protein n=1 Tax=unclassified Duganella TaxID=2636909 RepID=UPI001314EAC3|nr:MULTISPECIES: NHL repeat-containing protein [unclassified Duganella]
MKKRLLAAGALAMVLMVAACGGGSGSGAVTPPLPDVPSVKLGSLSLLAGSIGGGGTLDGKGTAARFSFANRSVADSAGNIYVTDLGNHTVRKISPGGDVTTLAGKAGQSGSTDGAGDAARLSYPSDLVIDSKGNLLVLEPQSVRKITPAGNVSTLFASNNTAFQFSIANNLAIDKDDNVYVSDTGAHHIHKITPAGVASTLPVSLGSPDTVVTIGEGYNYNGQRGVAVDAAGNVYAAETADDRIRKIAPDGTASVYARLPKPNALLLDASGALLATSASGISKISADGSVSAMALTPADQSASSCATGMTGVGLDGAGKLVIGAGNVVCRVTAGVATVLAGMAGESGSADGTGAAARFDYIGGITLDTAGNLFVTNGGNGVRKITPAGVTATIANTGNSGAQGIAVDQAGNVLMITGTLIRKVATDGTITTLAGNDRLNYRDGVGADAAFNYPQALTIDAAGNLYVADSGNNAIRKVTPAGVVTTVVSPSSGQAPYPVGIARDAAGNLFFTGDNRVFKVSSDGKVSTLAGDAASGYQDGSGASARFNHPRGIAIDKNGNLYVADVDNQTVRKISAAGVVTTVAGKSGVLGISLGVLPGTLDNPRQIASSPDGVLYVSTPQAVLKIEQP